MFYLFIALIYCLTFSLSAMDDQRFTKLIERFKKDKESSNLYDGSFESEELHAIADWNNKGTLVYIKDNVLNIDQKDGISKDMKLPIENCSIYCVAVSKENDLYIALGQPGTKNAIIFGCNKFGGPAFGFGADSFKVLCLDHAITRMYALPFKNEKAPLSLYCLIASEEKADEESMRIPETYKRESITLLRKPVSVASIIRKSLF